jgi:hypothetical protein
MLLPAWFGRFFAGIAWHPEFEWLVRKLLALCCPFDAQWIFAKKGYLFQMDRAWLQGSSPWRPTNAFKRLRDSLVCFDFSRGRIGAYGAEFGERKIARSLLFSTCE